jgi:hypothetical protein
VYLFKTWAVAGDFIKPHLVSNFGGFYFDAKVEIHTPLDLFAHFEIILPNGIDVDMMACSPENKLFDPLLQWVMTIAPMIGDSEEFKITRVDLFKKPQVVKDALAGQPRLWCPATKEAPYFRWETPAYPNWVSLLASQEAIQVTIEDDFYNYFRLKVPSDPERRTYFQFSDHTQYQMRDRKTDMAVIKKGDIAFDDKPELVQSLVNPGGTWKGANLPNCGRVEQADPESDEELETLAALDDETKISERILAGLKKFFGTLKTTFKTFVANIHLGRRKET